MRLYTDPRLPSANDVQSLKTRLVQIFRDWGSALNTDVYGDKWEDLRFPAQAINPAGAASAPSVDDTTYPGTLLFSSIATNVIAGVAQMPHAWSRGTAVRPHIHWMKTTSAAGGVVWQFSYAVVDIGGTAGAYSDFAGGTTVVSDGNTANKHALTTFADIDLAGNGESCMILWKIQRKHDDAGDDYGADARLLEFDIHYRTNKRGTATEVPE